MILYQSMTFLTLVIMQLNELKWPKVLKKLFVSLDMFLRYIETSLDLFESSGDDR